MIHIAGFRVVGDVVANSLAWLLCRVCLCHKSGSGMKSPLSPSKDICRYAVCSMYGDCKPQ